MFTRQIKIAFILACVLTASCVSYSFASDNPVISEGPYIGSRHWGNNTEEEYSISCWLRISDPQGLDNIASVVANFPDGSFYAELFDDGNHCDDAPGDGGYGVCGNGMASPPPLGEYSIVVTDKDGNTVSGSTTVEHFLDFPTVFSPASGSVITNPQPAFTWNAVQGAVRYSLEIVNPENWELMWRQDDITGTSVTYNNDGTGQSLTEDILYRWGVSAWDDKENGSWHHTQISFIYSSDTEKPVMTDPIVRSRHWVGEPWESWGIDFWTNIGDLQGLNTIDSVWVEGPGDIRYELYDDGVHFDELANDGKFANWIGDLNEPPALGVYTFNVKDKSGNIVSATDTLTAVLDAPGNVMPVNDTIVSEQDVLFQWDAVPGAAWYEVQVTDQSWQHTFWSSGRELTQTSVRYNENGTGEDLTEGGLYKLVVRAGDGKNESERIIERIAYRASGQPGTIHVDISNTSGSEDGSSAHPFNTIQEGIDAAVSGDTVLVKSGTYVENISFNGKNITVQSAEGAEKTIIDGNKNGSVVGFWSGEGTTAILDGFTIRNGLTDGGGGGIDCGNSNPTLQNLIIKNNAAHDGGGINCYRSSPLMENLVISDNSAIWAAGGVHCTENSSPNILNATITGNSARFGGGITLWYESSPILRNVRIFENTAYNNGGGVNIDRNCNPSISNTTIAGNLSHQLGGGLSCFNGSAPNLENVTISGNLSEYGGGIYIGESDLTITNSISWNNTPQEIFFESWNIPASISVAYSDIQGGEAAIFRNGDVTINWSGGNIDSHPAFVNPSVLDYRLQSASPCINAGNPAAAYNDKDGTRNDMGAYGGPGGESYAYQDGPPSVEDVTITPSVAYPGTDVVITANVRDAVSGVKSVKAEIKRPNETLVGTINLYDDGLHNDGIAGDGIYGNSWTTPSGEDAYDIDITASDTQSHTADYKKAGTFSTQTIYDDFESAPIDLAKWEEYEQVREISDGKLHLNVQGDGKTSTSEIYLVNNDIHYYEAKVLVENGSYVSDGATGGAGLSGYFYNDSRGPGSGQDYNQHEGDVWLDIRIALDENGILKAKASGSRSDNADFSEETAILEQDFSLPINFDTEYLLSIELTDSEVVFKCNSEQLSYPLTSQIYEPYEKSKRLMSRVYADSGENGYMKVRFDDVCTSKGGAIYDDFESTQIDTAKWGNAEHIRGISNGKLRMGIYGSDQKTTISSNLLNAYTPYFESKVIIESGQVAPGATAAARLGGTFYNDSRGPGSGQPYNGDEGDVWLVIRIILDENNELTATTNIQRVDDANFETYTMLFEEDFSTPINFGTEYIFSIAVEDSKVVFKCNNETKIYQITTPIYLSHDKWRWLSTRVYADPGEPGYIKAEFDDVRITKSDKMTIHVPNDQPTIQAAIDAAKDGDTVIVHPGTYVENINFNGKNIVVASLAVTTGDIGYISETIIDGDQKGSVVSFNNGENSDALLNGFTITNGLAEDGGGINCNLSRPTLKNLIITDNMADNKGGGINISNDSYPDLEAVIIRDNSAKWGGGVNVSDDSDPDFLHIKIMNNTASEGGGGINIESSSSPDLKNVLIIKNSGRYGGGIRFSNISYHHSRDALDYITVADNSAEQGGGVFLADTSSYSALFERSIFWNNTPHQIYLGEYETVKSVSIRYSDIQDGEAGVVISSNGTLDGSRGNIDADPLFSDPENGDYLVAMDSPCRDSKSAIIMGVSPFPGEPGSLKWKFEEAEHRFDAAPAIGDDGTIYVGSMDGNIYAVAPNGILKWKFDTGAAWVNSSAAIGTDGTVYIVSKDLQEPSNEKLYAISPDGSLKWNFSMNTGDSSPVIGADGTIYIGSDDKKLYAINPDGTLKWEFQTVNGINASPAIGVDGTIYAGVYGKFYAINPDGTLKWELDEISLRSSPAIATDGTIYINSDDEILYAIHPDGTEKWKFKIGYRGGYSSPVIGSDGTVYVGSYDKNFYAINPDGTKKWEFQTTGGIHSSSALGDDGVIYVGSSAINPDGTLKWRFKTDSWSANTPTIGPDGVVYFGAWDLYAIYSDSHGPADSSWPMFLHDAKHTGRSERNTKVVSLLPDAPYNGTITSSKLNDFSFEATAGKMLLVEVVPQTGVHSLILDGSFGEVPLFSGFGDYTTGDMTVRNQYDLLIPKTDSGMYYFSVYGEHIENSGGSYTITARYVDSPYLSDMSRSSTLNQGSITLTVTGLGFNQATQVSLTGAGLSKLTPSELVVFSSTELLVSFDVEGIQPGIYSVQIGETGSISSVFNEFEIKSDGVPGHMRTVITAPAGVRTNREYSFEVEYQNDGETDLPVPLFVISNSLSGQMRLSELEARKQELIQVLGIIRENTATLRHVSPGRSGRFRGRFRVVPTPSQDVTITVEKMIADLTYIDWQKIESDIRPDDIDDDAWNIIWSNFKAQLGNTWQDYYRNLTDAGVYIGRYDWYKNTGLFAITGELFSKPYNDISQFEVGNLLAFEFAKASARLCPRSVLASAQDVFVPAPGLSLSFERFAFQSIESRFAQGAFGRGWTHAYDYTASIDEEKNVRIKAPNKSVRMFYYQNYNNYQGAAGDYGTVSLRSNNVVLREKDGAVWRFEANGKLSSIEDLNGNSLSFSYAGDELENITHSNGESIAITYDPNGKIYQITDPAGRTVTYTYDASGEHLVKVEESGGITTAYEYHLADGTASAHALKAITFPDKTRQYYSFDSKGRLAKEWRAGNTEVLTYTYDKQGTVTISDALGHSGLVRFGANGEILETRDPLGALAKISYNPQKQVTEIVHPDGNTTAVAYDAKGNPIGIRNPMNQLIQMNYEPEHSRLAKLTDSRSNETEFDYDERGNLQSITYPDASAESFEYDDFGNVSTYTNRRGNPIQYSFSTRGQITRKVYPDGRIIDYQYDTKGNLTGATDSLTGTISMEYDSRDFLTEIEYPGGYGFRFEYDSAGRRTKRISHDGDALGYHYDTAGRLQKLTDKNNEAIVQYEYDENGRLKREVKGNGTQTVYEYDPAGQLLSMVNYSPGGAVQSRFDYAYDVNGNRTSMTTLNGTTSYQYDDMGQLVEVAYPDGREVIYEYDPAGNRISVTDNGVVTDYMTNNMNQYTHAGEASYTYDDDGNMISKTDTKGTTTYEYDAENRLIRVNTPSDGTWEYAYDAFGNRIRVNHNGTETRYVHDPIGLVDVAGEYDGTGALVARYTHGLGLVARSDDSGNAAYYAFDGIGHTRQMTDSAGIVVNSYDYSPFGISLKAEETIANPFRYVGRFGVISERNELQFMRARFYNNLIGRFFQQDPIGIFGGFNLYSYTNNNPVITIDPFGLIRWDYFSSGFSTTIQGIIGIFSPGNIPLIGQISAAYAVGVGIGTMINSLFDIESVNSGGLFKDLFSLFSDKREFQAIGSLLDMGISFRSMDISAEGIEKFYDIATISESIYQSSQTIYSDLASIGSKSIEIVRPRDPNEKTASLGVGDQHYIVAGEELSYTVYFENKSTATAPAQEVFVTDSLSEDLDWSTFKLGDVSFGKHIVSSLADKQNGKDRLILENMAVDIEANFSTSTGLIKWTLRTLDLETGELPEDAYAGFLPPEDGNGSGQGYVSFTVKAKSDLPKGTQITNKATIVFDTEAPITTNEVFNTITDDAPDASLMKPNTISGAADVSVSSVLSWSSADFATAYDLYLWKSGQNKPIAPVADDLKTPFFDASSVLQYGTSYNWQVVAKNVMGESESPVWHFTTESVERGDLNGDQEIDIRDAVLALQVLSGIKTGITKAADVNDDGKTDWNEVFYIFRVLTDSGSIDDSGISGIISKDTVWTDFVAVTGDVTVADGVTLTVDPGTYIEFQGHYKLDVQGTLTAKGTPEQRITFTAKNTSEGWRGIRFDNDTGVMHDNPRSELVYCNIHYGNATPGGRAGKIHDDKGGAVLLQNFSNLLISNCLIANNRAVYTGGGIRCYLSSPVIRNSIIANNTANIGGGVYCYLSNPVFTNNTVVNNTADIGGGLCFSGTSEPVLRNTAIWGNTSDSAGNQIALLQDEADPYFDYCNIQGGTAAFGGEGAGENYDGSLYQNSISANPLFAKPSSGAVADVDALASDWSLEAGSPCINAGDPDTPADEAGTEDFAGSPRISGEAADIGACEYQE